MLWNGYGNGCDGTDGWIASSIAFSAKTGVGLLDSAAWEIAFLERERLRNCFEERHTASALPLRIDGMAWLDSGARAYGKRHAWAARGMANSQNRDCDKVY